MFVLLVSDHVGLVVCLEQAPGLRTNKYADSAFGVHVEVEYLLGLLSVADLNSLHPKLRTCCRCRVGGNIPWFIVTVTAEMMHLGGNFFQKMSGKRRWNLQVFDHLSIKARNKPGSEEGAAGHFALQQDFSHLGLCNWGDLCHFDFDNGE